MALAVNSAPGRTPSCRVFRDVRGLARAAGVAAAVAMAGLACGGGSGERSPAPPAPDTAAAPQGLPPGHPSILTPSHTPMTPAGGAAAGAAPVWDVPKGWRSGTPSSRMRQAQYAIPAAAGDGEDGECAVFYFGPGQGGDVRSNIDRWAQQFTGPSGAPAAAKVSEVRTGSLTVTRVEASGTYHASPMSMTGGPPPEPMPGYALLGAIVPGGDSNWFFKCSGPQRTMEQNRAAFDAMIASVRPGP